MIEAGLDDNRIGNAGLASFRFNSFVSMKGVSFVSGNNNQRKGNSSKSNNQYDVAWVNHYWNDDDENAFLSWLKSDAPDEWEALQSFIDQGYKVNFGTDNYGAFRCTMTMAGGLKHVHSGLGFSSFAETPLDAFLLTIFKVTVIYAKGAEGKPSGGERRRHG